MIDVSGLIDFSFVLMIPSGSGLLIREREGSTSLVMKEQEMRNSDLHVQYVTVAVGCVQYYGYNRTCPVVLNVPTTIRTCQQELRAASTTKRITIEN